MSVRDEKLHLGFGETTASISARENIFEQEDKKLFLYNCILVMIGFRSCDI